MLYFSVLHRMLPTMQSAGFGSWHSSQGVAIHILLAYILFDASLVAAAIATARPAHFTTETLRKSSTNHCIRPIQSYATQVELVDRRPAKCIQKAAHRGAHGIEAHRARWPAATTIFRICLALFHSNARVNGPPMDLARAVRQRWRQ